LGEEEYYKVFKEFTKNTTKINKEDITDTDVIFN
jgi:hypothetical protein